MKKIAALIMLSVFFLFVGGNSYAYSKEKKEGGIKTEQFKKMDNAVVYDFAFSVEVAVLPKPFSEIPDVIGKVESRPAEARSNSPPERKRFVYNHNPNARIRRL